MKKIAVVGSTGVIGSQALEIGRSYAKDLKVVSLVCGRNAAKFKKQVEEFRPKMAVVAERDGEDKVLEAVRHPEVELVLVAVVGLAGLKPTLAAIRAGKDVALATKEVLVVAGELVMKEVVKYKVNLIPVDSEHSAIFQGLKAGRREEIKKLILTMGKGRLALMKKKELDKVTMAQVLKRKTWRMGMKIGVDSATCMNKAFEVIEASWLFGVKPEKIEIVVQPEYLCHSMVEFVDGSVMAELGVPDMRRYIQYALFYPERREVKRTSSIDWKGKVISFEKPPMEKFECLKMGHRVLRKGGTMPAVLHGADRVGVEAFGEGRIGFMEIAKVIDEVLRKHKVVKNPGLKEIIKAEKRGGEMAEKIIEEGLK